MVVAAGCLELCAYHGLVDTRDGGGDVRQQAFLRSVPAVRIHVVLRRRVHFQRVQVAAEEMAPPGSVTTHARQATSSAVGADLKPSTSEGWRPNFCLKASLQSRSAPRSHATRRRVLQALLPRETPATAQRAYLMLWAGSVLTRSTCGRTAASCTASEQLHVVLPTPPFPPTNIQRSEFASSSPRKCGSMRTAAQPCAQPTMLAHGTALRDSKHATCRATCVGRGAATRMSKNRLSPARCPRL